MTDPRIELRAVLAQWLRVRADVRALDVRLAAAHRALSRDAQASDDPRMDELLGQVATERAAVAKLAGDLDIRIAEVNAACASCEAAFRRELLTRARIR